MWRRGRITISGALSGVGLSFSDTKGTVMLPPTMASVGSIWRMDCRMSVDRPAETMTGCREEEEKGDGRRVRRWVVDEVR